MKRGSILLLALFLILFIITVIAVLYLTSKRYVLLAKEQKENYKNISEYQKINLTLYIINNFIKNKGSMNTLYSLKNYTTHNENYELYRIKCKLTKRGIYYTGIPNFIYANIYDNNEKIYSNLPLFQKNLINLYKYDKNSGLVYMPSDIKNLFEKTGLLSSEKEILKEYKKILIEYIKDTFGIKDEKSLEIVSKLSYDQQTSSKEIYQTSIRPTKIAIKFKIGNNNYYLLTSDFYLKNELTAVRLYDKYHNENLLIEGIWGIKTTIYQVDKTKIEKSNKEEDLLYPYDF